jgi:hypothetical protein
MSIPELGCSSAVGISKHAFSSRTACLWVITQRVVVILTTFRDNLSVPSSGVKKTWKDGPISCFETSVINYRYSLSNNPEECSSHLLRGGSLQSRTPSTVPNVVSHAISLRKGSVFSHNLTVLFDNCVLTTAPATTLQTVRHTLCLSPLSRGRTFSFNESYNTFPPASEASTRGPEL